jgi:hypothetical protein
MPKKPDLFIIGAAKCGTTSVYEWLKGHPEVFMSPAKEPRYFATDLLSKSGWHYPDDEARYLALFEEATDQKRLGEASVRYIYSRTAPALIRDFQPKPYIVAMLRNPVDMLYSLHQQRLADGAEDITDFEQALAADDDRRGGRRVPYGGNPLLTLYKPRARFAEQLEPWLATFGERLHIIVLEDLIARPEVEWRRLLEFLDVDPTYRLDSFVARNASHAPRSQRLLRLSKSRVPQWLVWRVMPRLMGDRVTRRLVRGYRYSAVNRKPAQRKPMSAELRARLVQEYSPDVERLSAMLGRDFSNLWFGRGAKEPVTASEPAVEAG